MTAVYLRIEMRIGSLDGHRPKIKVSKCISSRSEVLVRIERLVTESCGGVPVHGGVEVLVEAGRFGVKN